MPAPKFDGAAVKADTARLPSGIGNQAEKRLTLGVGLVSEAGVTEDRPWHGDVAVGFIQHHGAHPQARRAIVVAGDSKNKRATPRCCLSTGDVAISACFDWIAIGLPWPATLSALGGKFHLPGANEFA